MRRGLGAAIIAGLILASASGSPAADSAKKAKRAAAHDAAMRKIYPPESLEAREEGVVHVAITVDRGVTTCAITKSSGFPRLDAATCAMAVANAPPPPAVPPTTNPRPIKIHYGSVEWRLPSDLAKTAPAAPAPAPAATERPPQ